MFDNIGQKIKKLAMITFIVLSSIFVLDGFISFMYYKRLVHLLICIIGPFVAWISSFLLYGFGELVDNSSKIKSDTEDKKKNQEIIIKELKKLNGDIQIEEKKQKNWTCENCGTLNDKHASFCYICGNKKEE